MSDQDAPSSTGRRRVLAGLVAFGAAGGAAVFGWLRRPGASSSETVAGRSITTPTLRSSAVEGQGAESQSVAETTSTSDGSTTTTGNEPSTTSSDTTNSDTTNSDTTNSDTTNSDPAVDIPVICRQAWGAAPPTATMPPHTVERLTVHHTASPISRAADAPAKLRTHQRFHQRDRGWADIAYHFLIDPLGNVYQGRDPSVRGDTATNYDPSGHLLICLEGDYDQAGVNDAQIAALANVLAWGVVQFNVEISSLAGHRDYADTRCPGDAVYTLLVDGSVADKVNAILANGRPRLTDTCGGEGEHLIAEIEASTVQL